LGTNPFAYAAPAGEEDPIFLDIASSAVAGGKIRVFQGLGQKVPDTWLVDTEGVPTTDPFAYPFAGSLQPFAGHKGYGLAVMVDILQIQLYQLLAPDSGGIECLQDGSITQAHRLGDVWLR